uniref:Uncharacterized protein n=1 Tax=Brassica campestris TaxID=3711 RepID=A0A3P6AFP5_BRACM|nr:unnamed protein product [Brassica rapa]
MPKHEYESLREEDRALIKLQSHLLCHLHLHDCELEKCVSLEWSEEAVLRRREATAFECVTCFQVLFNQETVDFYWMVVFIQSMIVFLVSSVYLVAGDFLVVLLQYYRNFCGLFRSSPSWVSKSSLDLKWAIDLLDPASGKFTGGVRCLSILNVVFAIILRSPSYISRLKPPDTRKQLFCTIVLVLRGIFMGFGSLVCWNCFLP